VDADIVRQFLNRQCRLIGVALTFGWHESFLALWTLAPGLWTLEFRPLQECSGSFSLSGIKVQSTQMEEDVRLETLFVPIAKGLFDQPLDFIV
jgi:hypothetical protein